MSADGPGSLGCQGRERVERKDFQRRRTQPLNAAMKARFTSLGLVVAIEGRQGRPWRNGVGLDRLDARGGGLACRTPRAKKRFGARDLGWSLTMR